MATPLLQTKFYIPPFRPELVPRPRLVERLEEGVRLGRQLTLISAPAGFGKTTLLSEWMASHRRGGPRLERRGDVVPPPTAAVGRARTARPGGRLVPRDIVPSAGARTAPLQVAWLSLDPGDADLARFLAYLIAALQAALQRIPALREAGVGDAALAMLDASLPQPPPVEAILTALINEIAALSATFVLVLDDYHLIQAQPVHDALTFLLDHLPPQIHLVIATRADPPLPIARLRGRGQLTELRQTDLCFTAQEASEYLNQAMGLDLSADDVTALESRTEGWIVGLQLAALSLQDRADRRAFIDAFGGGHHYVLEYLVQEVVRGQPEPIRRFLVQTSILDRLCGPLCDAVRLGDPQSSGEDMLAYLQRRNLFILPLDDEHRWYRYHHLFADLLGNLLRKEHSPEQIRELHLRACAWYDQNGWPAEAMHHALAAPDYEWAAQMIERHSLAMLTRGELAALLRWIDALPPEVARSRPWLCIHQAWPLTFAGRVDAVQPLLQRVEALVSSDDVTSADAAPESKEILGNVAAMRAMLSTFCGDMRQAVELAQRADELLPVDSLEQRSVLLFARASAYLANGELAQADRALVEKVDMGRACGNIHTIVRSLCDLADLRMLQGRFGIAAELVQGALQEAEQRGARQFGTVGYALVKLAELSYERYDLEAARAHVLEGIQLMRGWQQPYELVSGYTRLAAILQAQNEPQGALEALQQVDQIQGQHADYYKLNSIVKLCRITLCLDQEGPEAAARQAMADRLGESDLLFYREREQIVLARIRVAEGRWEEALQFLAPLARDAEAGGRFGRLIQMLALQAAALWQQGEHEQALQTLEKALALGGLEGYLRFFVDLGAPMARLLSEAVTRGIRPDYAGKLLATFPDLEAYPAAKPEIQNLQSQLVEPLTDRELEVLELIGQGYSNQQISQMLVISLNTVKKHASGIYGKLGVHSRTQAVARAQELGLL